VRGSAFWVLSGLAIAGAQEPALKEQLNDAAGPRLMPPAELAKLGDPLFLLVLKNAPGTVKIDEIESALQGASGRRHLFVVHEEIMDPSRGARRRSVTAYSGTTSGVRLDPNVMLSQELTDEGFLPETIEALGWDDKPGRYNYYKLDRQPGEPGLSWKFRGSSIDADKRKPEEREGTCLACHINGAPLMKEMFLPWNNWHSPRAPVPHLDATNPGRWDVAATPAFRALESAENLESFLLPAIRKSNGRRIDALVRKSGATLEVIDGPRLLRPLFGTVEYNIASAVQLSGLHPLPAPGAGPSAKVVVPDVFFLNANLLAGGGGTQYEGLGIVEARGFGKLLELAPEEYRDVVARRKTRLGLLSGDANFAWLTPVASHIDNHMIDALLRRGVITPGFAAAVLALDVETPVFSDAAPQMLRFIPERFKFRPRTPGGAPAAHPDELTKTVVARIRAARPEPGSTAAEFLALLESPNPVERLRMKLKSRLDEIRKRLGDAGTRGGEIDRLYGVLLARRRAAIEHPVLQRLVESDRLFPLGN